MAGVGNVGEGRGGDGLACGLVVLCAGAGTPHPASPCSLQCLNGVTGTALVNQHSNGNL